MTTLRVLIDAAPARGRAQSWALFDDTDACVRTGRDAPDAWPAADRGERGTPRAGGACDRRTRSRAALQRVALVRRGCGRRLRTPLRRQRVSGVGDYTGPRFAGGAGLGARTCATRRQDAAGGASRSRS